MSIFTRPFLLAAILTFAATCFVSPVSASATHRKKVIITLNRRNVYFLDNKRIAKDQIEPLLTARVRTNPSVMVVIRADPHQTFERVSQLVDLIKQSGVRSIMMTTRPPHRARSAR